VALHPWVRQNLLERKSGLRTELKHASDQILEITAERVVGKVAPEHFWLVSSDVSVELILGGRSLERSALGANGKEHNS